MNMSNSKDCQKKVSLKEIRKTYFELRSFEISNLWQRSIFLSAFLVLLFTAYGFVASEFTKPSESYIIINEILCGISILGIIYSIIWIMMAKGSKAWYEVYENNIVTIEIEDELGIPEQYRMGATCETFGINSNIFSTKAGNYSVSKLNILLGIILFITWLILFTIHYAVSIICYNQLDNCNTIHVIVLVLILIFLLSIIISAIFNKWAKSGALSN